MRLPTKIINCIAGAVAAMLLLSGSSTAQDFVEGSDYTVISPRVKTNVAKDKIEVIEFFWYGCPHCYTIEPALENWEVPENVEFLKVPATFSKTWVVHAKVYYALKALDRLDLHPLFFDALHGTRRQKGLTSLNKIAEFFANARKSMPKDQFTKAYNSFVVKTQIQRAAQLVKNYKIRSVPTFIVNGRYLSSPSMVGSNQDMIKVLDYLIALEQKPAKRKQPKDKQPKS